MFVLSCFKSIFRLSHCQEIILITQKIWGHQIGLSFLSQAATYRPVLYQIKKISVGEMFPFRFFSSIGAFLYFLDNLLRGHKVQNAISGHFIAHIFETSPKVIDCVINQQEPVVNRPHRL